MLDRFPARMSLVHMLPQVAEERGIDHVPVFAAVGLDGNDPTWSGQVVARARIAALLMLLAREAGDEALGLGLASAADPVVLGPAGLALGIGRTLGEGLASHIRHMPSLQGGLDYQLLREGNRVRLLHRYHGGTAEEARVLSEGVAAFMLKAVRDMAGDESLPVHIEFPHRPRVSATRYEDRLRAAVTFRPGDTIRLSFDARCMTLANRANRNMDKVESRTLAQGDSVLDDGALVAAIARTFAPAALAGRLTLSHVTAMLGLAPRSLQRRLSGLGLRFEDLVDEWRRELSCRMLITTSMPVGDVGRMLGYSDPAHFTRAFHRWHRTSPVLWRRQHD
jgi:AraC-like DNA-binding protein